MSFENISDKTKKTNLFLFALYTFISVISMLILPFVAFLGLSFLAVPATTLVLKKQTGRAFWCVLMALAIVFLFNYVLAFTLIALIAMIAYFYKYCTEKQKDTRYRILGIAGLIISAFLLYILLFSLINGFGALPEAAKGYNEYIDNIAQDPVIESYRNILGMDATELDSAIGQLQSLMRFIPKIIPGIMIGFIGLASLLNYKFTHLFSTKYGVQIKDIKTFKDWDLSWYFCWGIIFGLVFILIPDLNPGLDITLDVLGANLLIIFGIIYTVLGLAVIWSLFERFKLGTAIRVVILIIMFLFFGLVIVPIIIGLIDIWANFRKLKRG